MSEMEAFWAMVRNRLTDKMNLYLHLHRQQLEGVVQIHQPLLHRPRLLNQDLVDQELVNQDLVNHPHLHLLPRAALAANQGPKVHQVWLDLLVTTERMDHQAHLGRLMFRM